MAITKNNEIKADDVTSLEFFPVGIVMMYDGADWKDNETLKGWYKCAGQSVTINGASTTMLDLRDKFIRASSNSGAGSTTAGYTKKLTTVPSHTHTFTSTVSSASQAAHSHTIDLSAIGSAHNHRAAGNRIMDSDTGGTTSRHLVTTWYYDSDQEDADVGGHKHSVPASISAEYAGSDSPEEFSVKPLCYKMIFIKKMV
jgi:hypothetical protein